MIVEETSIQKVTLENSSGKITRYCQDIESVGNLTAAVADLEDSRGFRPALCLLGEPASGKSAFAYWYLSSLFDSPTPNFPARASKFGAEIEKVFEAGYLWIDDVPPRGRRNKKRGHPFKIAGDLAGLIQCKRWWYRKLYESRMSYRDNDLRIVITANERNQIPEEILRRSRVVELVNRGGRG